LKALIIGGGVAADIHCRVLQSLDVEIGGVYDISLDKAKKMADNYGAKAYDDLDEALESDIDFAVICTPNGTHAKLLIQVMNAGKNVVVEKPFALTAEDCDKVLEVHKKTGVICAPISQLRFSKTYRRVQKCLERGEFGKLVMSSLSMKYYRTPDYYANSWKGTIALDGGELMNQGVHGIDVMCGLLGKPTEVSGYVCTQYHDIEAEDTAVAFFKFPSGIVGTVDSSTAISHSKPRRFEISGQKGTIVLEEDKIVLAEGVNIENPEDVGEYNGSRDPKDIGLNLHTLNYINILAAFRGEAELKYKPEDAANTVKVICAINESSKTGKVVKL